MRALFSLLFAVVFGVTAHAEDVTVSLKTPLGQPVADAVVTFKPSGGAPAPKPAGPYFMVQENIHFIPFVLIVPVGSDVGFPNHDKVRHHVYSFSEAKSFQLKLYGRDETRSIHFDRAGVVALGCNIHDTMSAFIDVVDTPYAVKTDDRGEAVLTGLPPGPGVLTVWQPFLKAPRNAQSHPITISADAKETYVLDLRPAPPKMNMAMP
jgi:plastocyanin